VNKTFRISDLLSEEEPVENYSGCTGREKLFFMTILLHKKLLDIFGLNFRPCDLFHKRSQCAAMVERNTLLIPTKSEEVLQIRVQPPRFSALRS
jgi:hypothetical protein